MTWTIMYEAHPHCRDKKGLWEVLVGIVTQGKDGRHLSSIGEGKVFKPLENFAKRVKKIFQ